MIFNYEIDNLTEDELALLQYIVTEKGTDESKLSLINVIRKEYISTFLIRNKQSLNQKGLETAQSLMRKLTFKEKVNIDEKEKVNTEEKV